MSTGNRGAPENDLAAPDPIARAAAAAALGVKGSADGPGIARLEALVADEDAGVRAAAIAALTRLGAISQSVWMDAANDLDADVRRRAAEVAPETGLDVVESLIRLLADEDPLAAEAAAFALGECSDDAVAGGATATLSAIVQNHADPLVRESAVAALGSLADPGGLEAVLAAMHDRPQIRRRAVLALAAFEGPEVEAALRAARDDRDWQVRQAAEDLMGP